MNLSSSLQSVLDAVAADLLEGTFGQGQTYNLEPHHQTLTQEGEARESVRRYLETVVRRSGDDYRVVSMEPKTLPRVNSDELMYAFLTAPLMFDSPMVTFFIIKPDRVGAYRVLAQ